MEINTESYNVWYDATNQTIFLKGSLRLSGTEEYKSIVELLNSVVDRGPSIITLNLEKLEFLNSSGINMLSKFVINVRKKKGYSDDSNWLKGNPVAREVFKELTAANAFFETEISRSLLERRFSNKDSGENC